MTSQTSLKKLHNGVKLFYFGCFAIVLLLNFCCAAQLYLKVHPHQSKYRKEHKEDAKYAKLCNLCGNSAFFAILLLVD